MRQLILGLCLLLFACPTDDCQSSPAGPTTTTVSTTSTTSVPVKLPRADRAPDIASIRIYSAFALPLRDEATITAIVMNARSHGFDTPRVCLELEGWPDERYLPRGPNIETKAAIENVERVFDVTARIPNTYVLAVPVCTIKENGRSYEKIKWWTRKVAEIVAREDYRHVIWEAVNEHYHPNSSLKNERKVIPLIETLQRITGLPAGTDDSVVRGNVIYNPGLRHHVDFLSVHPWRNPDPSGKDIERIVERNGGQVVLSETTSYVTPEQMELYFPNGSGLVTSDKEQILRYGRRCKRQPGCVWSFHSVDGLKCEGPFAWMPQWSQM
ncbi:MAG: hypothetical protein JSV16_13315 [Candidatus Hydrogenedentota bacterium]|nr:MAG: hypothetical protein JSV16_13315 [Candidatus Hydrogenedentota bacterium]